MLRKMTVAALALSVAGGVYLAAAPAQASNMGFKLERNLRAERDDVSARAFQNLYYVSFPLFNGLDPDLANSADASQNKCVGDPGLPPGPLTGDGILNADDALCDLWTSRLGLMTFSRWVNNECRSDSRSANINFANQVQFSGLFTIPLEREVGYEVVVGSRPGVTLDNRTVIVGSHDPSYPGQTLHVNCRPQKYYLNLPYHTMYRTVDEMMCGLEITDWQPDPGDGHPLTCPRGVYDTTAITAPYKIDILTFDNVEDFDGPAGRNTDNTFINRSLTINFAGQRVFTGDDFRLIPGDAYIVGLPQTHADTTWLSPHF
jgi:hypothetical protein